MATIGEDIEGMSEGRNGRGVHVGFFGVSHEGGRGEGVRWKGSELYVRMVSSWFESLIGCHVKYERMCSAYTYPSMPCFKRSSEQHCPPIVTNTALARQRHSPGGRSSSFGSQFTVVVSLLF